MPFDYTTAAAIARYEPVHTETLRDFAYAARQTSDELQRSKQENSSLQREIRILLGEIDVLKSSLLEAEAVPQPAVPEGYVPVPRAAVTEVLRISDRQHPAWDAVKAALLSAAKGETE
jgi:hypothetical protein